MKRVAKPTFAAWCATGMTGLSLLSAASYAADNSPAINALLQQAVYWHDKSHDDLARESLQNGNQAQSAKWRARLTTVSPMITSCKAWTTLTPYRPYPRRN
ncbi:hypothetical protein [Sodalis glossinidius]|uniref:hypothetical protein n=1 Tax=Sodalis glossinidius TaxID=63612 RepID=UPI000320F2D6